MISRRMWGAVVCAILALTSCTSDDPVDPIDGLLANLTFSGNAADASGSGNDGTLLGGATVSSYLTVGHNAADALRLPGSALDGRADFTIAAWVRLTTLRDESHFLVSAASASEDNVLDVAYDEVSGAWHVIEASARFDFAAASSVEDGLWHHIVVTRSGTTARIYVDGSAAAPSISVPGNVLEVAAGGLVFGQDQDQVGGGFEADQSWAGDIDNLRLYDRALTAAEVSSLSDEPR